jgi:hypothetical protein
VWVEVALVSLLDDRQAFFQFGDCATGALKPYGEAFVIGPPLDTRGDPAHCVMHALIGINARMNIEIPLYPIFSGPFDHTQDAATKRLAFFLEHWPDDLQEIIGTGSPIVLLFLTCAQ